MPDKFLVAIIFSLLPLTLMGASPAAPASAGLKGDVVSYLELSGSAALGQRTVSVMPCHVVRTTHTTLTRPEMFGLTTLDAEGNIVTQTWYAIESLERDGTPEIEFSDLHDTRTYYFFDDEQRHTPRFAITVGDGDTSFGFFAFDPSCGTATAYRMECYRIFENVYTYRAGLAASYYRISNGIRDFTLTYGYSKNGTRLVYAETRDGDGRLTNRVDYDRNMRIRKMTIHGRDGRYSYRYRYTGGGDDHTYTMEMAGGRHPFYNHGVYEVTGGLMTGQRVTTALPLTEAGGKKEWGEKSATEARVSYNRHGDYTRAVSVTGEREYINDTWYLYDPQGNWYAQTTVTDTRPDQQVQTMLRAIEYRK